ncbi:MAG TPA: site-2 protease family protein [Candidatus Limnocylindria bacterium]
MLFGDAPLEQLIAGIIALLVGLTFHEFSHAYVADQLGDHRPRAMGRVTLNPIPHIDPIGALLLLVAGFGWAKPVLVNPAALRNGRAGLAMVAAAGPIANLSLAVVFAIVFRVLGQADIGLGTFVGMTIFWVVVFNVVLAIFNLLPIPPLDGYNVALAFLPPRQALFMRRYGQYGIFVLLVLVILSSMNSPIDPLGWILGFARDLARLLLGV